MDAYNPPVAGLLKLGRPDTKAGLDYLAFGIGPEHVHDLLRMLNDKELFSTDPEWYAQTHAWRALGQLRPPEAVEPLLDLLAENSTAADWSDWILEDVPHVLAKFGEPALAATTRRLNAISKHGQVSQDYSNVLTAIGLSHPELRAETIAQICRILSCFADNDFDVNGFIVSDLLELKATEAWPVIEQAYSAGCVDESICGDLDYVKFKLGLGPEPPPRRYNHLAGLSSLASINPPHFGPARQNAKQRFNERQRKKKLEKKLKKKRN